MTVPPVLTYRLLGPDSFWERVMAVGIALLVFYGWVCVLGYMIHSRESKKPSGGKWGT